MTDQMQADPANQPLPPGVHPNDPSVPWSGGYLHEPSPVPPDRFGVQYSTGDEPFPVSNGEALPVWERASHDWTANTITLAGTLQVIGRQPGRKSVTLWNPTSSTNNVIIAPTQGEVDQIDGATLAPGDSITLYTEAPVWAGLASGKTSAVVCVVAEINPPGGAYGSS